MFYELLNRFPQDCWSHNLVIACCVFNGFLHTQPGCPRENGQAFDLKKVTGWKAPGKVRLSQQRWHETGCLFSTKADISRLFSRIFICLSIKNPVHEKALWSNLLKSLLFVPYSILYNCRTDLKGFYDILFGHLMDAESFIGNNVNIALLGKTVWASPHGIYRDTQSPFEILFWINGIISKGVLKIKSLIWLHICFCLKRFLCHLLASWGYPILFIL